MDLSRIKWPVIIAVIVGGIWLGTTGGVNWMVGKVTAQAVGEDPKKDEANEATLSSIAGFLIKTFRYASAEKVLITALDRYPEGKNALNNQYRLAKCYEKQGRAEECIAILQDLRDTDAASIDDRIPTADVINLRIDKLAEINQIGEVGAL